MGDFDNSHIYDKKLKRSSTEGASQFKLNKILSFPYNFISKIAFLPESTREYYHFTILGNISKK